MKTVSERNSKRSKKNCIHLKVNRKFKTFKHVSISILEPFIFTFLTRFPLNQGTFSTGFIVVHGIRVMDDGLTYRRRKV